MKTSRLIKLAALLTGAFLSCSAHAQITANVDWVPDQASGGGTGGQFYLSDMQYADGSTALGGSAVGFCVEPNLISPGNGSTKTYALGPLTDIFRLQNAPETGLGAVYWLMDNYLDSHVLSTSAIPDLQRQDLHASFDSVLAEILQDWNGNYTDLDLNNGWKVVSSGSSYFTEASNMLNALKLAQPTADYISSSYQLKHFVNVTPESYETQNLLAVTPVPEPGSALLISIVGFMAILRRRR